MEESARGRSDSFFEQKDTKADTQSGVRLTNKSFKRITSRRSTQIIAVVVIILIILVCAFYWIKKEGSNTSENGKLSSSQVKDLIKEVGDKIVIPEGETPTIATVTDISKLSGQPFFKNAQNGDKVLIIGSTKEAILYRESIHKIISVAPINSTPSPLSPQNAQPVKTSLPTQIAPTVTIVASPTAEVKAR